MAAKGKTADGPTVAQATVDLGRITRGERPHYEAKGLDGWTIVAYGPPAGDTGRMVPTSVTLAVLAGSETVEVPGAASEPETAAASTPGASIIGA